MRKYIYWLIILILPFVIGCNESDGPDSTPAPPPSVSFYTPGGIRVIVDLSTTDQYEGRWELNWDGIDWSTLDEIFESVKEYLCYSCNWDCKDIDASYISVQIHPWDGSCIDQRFPTQPYQIKHPTLGCTNGWYQNQVAHFHLGDDPGVDNNVYGFYAGAFSLTAFDDELLHFFQNACGLPYADAWPQPVSIVTIILPCEKCGGSEFNKLDDTHIVCAKCGEIKDIPK